MTERFKLSRRGFITAMLGAGGALVMGLSRPAVAATVNAEPWDSFGEATSFTPWLRMDNDGKVTVYVTHPDIGNGPLTQACAYVREELACRWEDIRAEYAAPERNEALGGVYSEVGGALAYFSGRSTSEPRRTAYMTAAAGARERLKSAAGEAWGVASAEITVSEGMLSHSSGRSAPFTEFLSVAAAVTLAEEPKPKTREEWTFLTKVDPAKIQIPEIVTGKAIYGMDIRVPGMVYAALRQSPVMGGTLVSYDFEAIRHMPGVRAVVEVKPTEPGEPDKMKAVFPLGPSAVPAAVAVIADHYWQARTALDALPVVWDDGPGAKWANTEMMNDAAMGAARKAGDNIELSVGDVEAEFKKGGKILEAEYLTPYCDQVQMEPLNCTVKVDKDSVEVWTPSQHTQQVFVVTVQETGVAPEKVKVHQTFVGGGFGRRVYGDDSRVAVAVAKGYPGVPVHVIWSREESVRQGRYRPLMGAHLKARLGEDGLPSALLARVAGGPGFFTRGLADTALPLVLPNVQIESSVVRDFHIKTGPLRGPGFNSNCFFLESFLDDMARAAGEDPLDYRIRIYEKWEDEGWVKILKVLKEKSGWGSPLPKGQARGVAIGNWGMGGKPHHGTTLGSVVHAEVSNSGKLKVHRIDVAFDTGRVMNKDAVQVQLEGGAIFGLNLALNEKLNVEHGRIVEGNYDEYPVIRMGDTPEIHVHFEALTDHERYDEIGEPPVGPVGPALANAIFEITGKRLRTQPFREHDLSWGGGV
ncbi:xanthine dehydrogenase family protein molybdopterin-binding subunit [Pseudaminobacter sp. 19-2017]|uniref:Xanthine dehydrogenase family protein molybdopterin-binding subunit n=1 Tax=Pseudaminobacter soli (ex Zhang et al. 2022) TaxID=2831468 RepID=A0A942I1J9_9HYPH|nr:molybdopterin cofactor-binding domain-containing protein [Pseudaminobacter soli]MBS3647223.1 xanthine dehydrogenase family protein molybdopterin-binding subunit [Pseudaminobacter soli]